jgi:hypothetical protein
MLKIILILCLPALFVTTNAQQIQPCGFQKLFTIEPGTNKMTVLDLVNKSFKLTIVRRSMDKIPPYKTSGGDSIVQETMEYQTDSSACFKGKNTKLYLEFADSKLYKAYFVTEYSKAAYQEMVSNFNSLRNSIKTFWKFEKEIKISGNNTIGFGYDYMNTEASSPKANKVSLQYMDPKITDKNDPYQLEVLWANLDNTRMETSNY